MISYKLVTTEVVVVEGLSGETHVSNTRSSRCLVILNIC